MYQGFSCTRGLQSIVSGPVATASPGNLLAVQLTGPHLRPTDSKTLEMAPRNLCLDEPS